MLRPFPAPGTHDLKREPPAYSWESPLPAGARRKLHEVATARLQNGDVLVLSTQGETRAFELELGALLYPEDLPVSGRIPQLEDYLGIAS